MKQFKENELVMCMSSDGMDYLVIGDTYTVTHVYNETEISVKEIPEFVHFTKRFVSLEEKTK